MTLRLRLATLLVLLLVLAVYYGTGIHFVWWGDSQTYVAQTESIGSASGYDRPYSRSIGYPLFLALLLGLPWPALAIVVAQALLVIGAYLLLDRHLRAVAPAIAPGWSAGRAALLAGLPLALALTASYSALQVFVTSLLPEILFAVLVLFAVLAVIDLVRREAPGPFPLAHGAVVAAVAAMPELVKPHWMLAGPVLSAVVAVKLVGDIIARPRGSKPAFYARLGAAALVPFLVQLAVVWPERQLAATVNAEQSLFGPRTLFCNHLHMIDDALAGDPGLSLHRDPAIDQPLREAIRSLRARDTDPWKHLGFNGDLCTFDMGFQGLVDRLIPGIEERRRLFLDGYLMAVEADPLRMAGKVAQQIAIGLNKSFEKHSYHVGLPFPGYLEPGFFAGTTSQGEAGPLGEKDLLKSTVLGWITLGVLAAIFFALLGVYLGLLAVTILATPFRWRHWPGDRRRVFLACLAVPVLAILAHHALIAIVHTFDIWRYSFGVFFVNLAFIGAAGLFWAEEWRTWRGPGKTSLSEST